MSLIPRNPQILQQNLSYCAILAALCAAAPAFARDADNKMGSDDSELLDMSLEDLLAMETTSVAKKRQSVEESAAAVTIISQEDTRRSTASTIPELSRMVPDVEVGPLANGGKLADDLSFRAHSLYRGDQGLVDRWRLCALIYLGQRQAYRLAHCRYGDVADRREPLRRTPHCIFEEGYPAPVGQVPRSVAIESRSRF